MRLPDFILANTERILAEWDAFARSIWPIPAPSADDVRDHAEAILRATALDMKSPQTDQEQSDKSRGLREAHAQGGKLNTSSSDHAVDRALSGFDLQAVISEYRALRASVVRLWMESIRQPDSNDLADLTRFHESMDQSLAEAVYRHSEHLDGTRQMFLRVLKHDLRNPLNAITIGGGMLAEIGGDPEETRAVAAQIVSSGNALGRMLNDFLDFAVTRLGSRVPVTPVPLDLEALCREVIAEIHTSRPHRRIDLKVFGEVRGEWDRDRLRQLLSNLVGNAVQHGDQTTPITLSASGDASRVTLTVHNFGPPIPDALQTRIFEPFVRGSDRGSAQEGSVGLGLYIAKEVARAHRGAIEVSSNQSDGTTFSVTLPRVPARLGAGRVAAGWTRSHALP